MSVVVYTSIQRIEDLAAAQWRRGDDHSYSNTEVMAEALSGNILLIGRKDKLGRVDLVCARSGRRDEFNSLRRYDWWVNVNASHVAVATFFSAKLAADPRASATVTFDRIDDAGAAKSARSLLTRECGTNGETTRGGEVHRAANEIQTALRALDVPAGDWTFVPIVNAYAAA